MPMDPRDKWRLRKNRVALLDIHTEEVYPYMLEEGLLTPDDMERIESEKTRKDKAQSFLNSLESQGEKAYRAFRNTLLKLEREDLVTKLDRTDVDNMPEKLQQELDALTSTAGDSIDRGNIIITETRTPTKRQVRVEDEGAAEARGQSRQPKRSREATGITVRGNNNVVMENSTVTINSFNTSRRY